MGYDSAGDTLDHISKVGINLANFVCVLAACVGVHDRSKLESPEKEIFDKFTPKLRNTIYGSDEYKQYLKDMGTALQHHYKNNRHHPEHFENGINGMTLMDIVEMFCDWQAAIQRHADGSLMNSLKHNKERFRISDQLHNILCNTAKELERGG